jgi:DNA-binding CsgD family transcriptional regulator
MRDDPRSLREAARTAERAAAGRDPPEGNVALDFWHELLAGRWSLVDRFDSQGRSCFVAKRSDGQAAARTALTPRERRVVTLSVLARPLKAIACELDVSLATVAKDRERATRKLGVRSMAELSALLVCWQEGEL